MTNQTKIRIQELEDQLLEYKKAYYIDDEPLVGDDEYDLCED